MIARLSAVLFVVLCSSVAAQEADVPARGFVPDASTAVAIARAVLVPIYGAGQVRSEEPLAASREGDVWVVRGTVKCPAEGRCVGGAVYVKLSALDGQILFVTHYK